MKVQNHTKRAKDLLRDNLSFLAVILITFLALLLVVVVTFGSYNNDARESAVTIGSMTVSQEARRIEDELSVDINTLHVSGYTVDSMLRRGADVQEIENYMVQETQGIITGIDSDFSGLYGVINDVYVDGIGWEPEAGYEPYERPWYTAAAKMNGELAIVSPYVDAQTGNVMLSFSKILSDGKSAISLDAQLDNIYAVTETIQLNGSGYCFLTDKNGNVIAHRDKNEVGKNYLTDPAFEGTDIQTLMERIYSSDNTETLQDVSLNGSDSMVFTQSVLNEWHVVLVVDSADVFHNIRVAFIRNIVASLLIFALVGYFCTSNYVNRKRAIQYAENIRIDVLTGINNRGEFDRYINTTVDSMSMDNYLYLMLFDADNFKSINDRYGHQAGDQALRLIANALMSVCHGTDWFCARYGGDEFVIVCKCGSEDTVHQIEDDVAAKLTAAAEENKLPYKLTLSCGYACHGSTTQSITALVDAADQKLYEEKARRHIKDKLIDSQP